MAPMPTLPAGAIASDRVDDRGGEHDVRRRQIGELLVSLRELSQFLTESIQRAQGGAFASNADIAVLIALRLDGPLRPRRLARIAGMTTGGMTNLLDRLEPAGLVRRSGDVEGDQRGVLVELTPTGIAATDRSAEAIGRAFTEATAVLDRLRGLFGALGHDVGAAPITGGGGLADLRLVRHMAQVGGLAGRAVASIAGPDDAAPWRTFDALWLAAGERGTRPRSIRSATHLSWAGTSNLLDRLEQRDLIRRIARSSTDGRAVTITITGEGRRLLESMIDAVEPLMGALADALFPT